MPSGKDCTMARSTWGSIRKKSSGVYLIRYTVGGKQKSETVRGTLSDAERRRSELRIKYEHSLTEMTLGQFWRNVYADDLAQKAPATIDEYERHWRRDIEPVFGDMLLRDINPRMIQSWLSPMTKGKARHCKAIISSVLSRALALDLIDDNPAQRRFVMPTELAPGRQRTTDQYTKDELDWIFDNAKGEPWEAAFIAAGFGGASREEAMSPKPDEPYEIDGWAVVPIVRGVQRLPKRVEIVDKTKTDDRQSDLVIPPPYSERYLMLCKEAEERGDEWLLDNGFGQPIDPNAMAAAYKRWFLDKPLRYIPFSNLRNSYATWTHAEGVDGLMVSKLMRHSQPTTTYVHYDKPTPQQKIAAIKGASE